MILWIHMQSRKIKWEKTCGICLSDPSLYSLVWWYPGVSIPIKWHNSMLLCDWLKLCCICPSCLKKFNRAIFLRLYCDSPFSKSCLSFVATITLNVLFCRIFLRPWNWSYRHTHHALLFPWVLGSAHKFLWVYIKHLYLYYFSALYNSIILMTKTCKQAWHLIPR